MSIFWPQASWSRFLSKNNERKINIYIYFWPAQVFLFVDWNLYQVGALNNLKFVLFFNI